MTWIAAHPDNVIEERTPNEEGAPHVSYGFWPPKISERIAAAMMKLRTAAEVEITDPRFFEVNDVNHDVLIDMVRYGVRGWRGDGLTPLDVADETIDGHPHKVLTPAAINLLHVNHMIIPCSNRAWFFNILTPEQKKTWGLRLPSATSKSPTSAPSAVQESKPRT